MWTTSEVCRISAAILAGLLAALLLRSHRRDPSAIASVILLAAVEAHLVVPLLLRRGATAPVVHAAVVLSLAVAPAFWMLTQVHFNDEFRVRRVHLILASGFLAIGYLAWLGTGERPVLPGFFPREDARFWALLPRILALAIVLHALMRVYVGAGTDLVLPRLRARFGVLLASGTYVLIVLVGEALFSDSESAAVADSLHSLAVLGLLLGVAFLSLRIAPEMLRAPRPTPDSPALDPALAERLRRLVEAGEVFREEALTIRGLAERLGTQEYKLRQVINSQLGFKNFNAFLNRYRVAAAERLLTDRGQAHLGIAEIAYQAGYRSVTTFNKAFKDLNGCTPSEYRTSRRA